MKSNGFFHFLAFAAYLFVAGASAVMTLQWNEDAGSRLGLAVGAGVFFGLIWVHEAVSARAQRRTAAAALAALAKSQAALEKKISSIQTKIDDVRATVGIGQGSGGQPDVVGEIR